MACPPHPTPLGATCAGVEHAAAQIEATAGVDERKQLALLRRKLAVELDRRVTLTAELKETSSQREELTKRARDAENVARRVEDALNMQHDEHVEELAAADARTENALLAAVEANERGAMVETALAEALRVREHGMATGAFQGALAEATANRLRSQLDQKERECDEASAAAAAHEAAAHAARARAERAERAHALSEEAIAHERAKANAAHAALEAGRERLERLERDVAERSNEHAALMAQEGAASARRRAGAMRGEAVAEEEVDDEHETERRELDADGSGGD